MKIKYLKYRSVNEIVETLGALPFKEYKKLAIKQILESTCSLDIKVDLLANKRRFGKTTKLLFKAILKSQAEPVMIVVGNYLLIDNYKTLIKGYCEKLGLSDSNIHLTSCRNPVVGYNNVYYDLK